MLLPFGSCSPSPPNPIVIFCSPDSPRMHQAIDGLQENLKAGPVEVVCAPEFGRELQTELRRVQQLKPRLLVVLGTPALMVVAPLEKNTPVVFALVADPYFTGAAYDPEHPEDHQENVTGLASPPPLKAALQQGAGLLGKAPWGLLYDPNDGVAAELAAGIYPSGPAVWDNAPDRDQLRGRHGPPGACSACWPGGRRCSICRRRPAPLATPRCCWTGANGLRSWW